VEHNKNTTFCRLFGSRRESNVCVCVLCHWVYTTINEGSDLPALKCSSQWSLALFSASVGSNQTYKQSQHVCACECSSTSYASGRPQDVRSPTTMRPRGGRTFYTGFIVYFSRARKKKTPFGKGNSRVDSLLCITPAHSLCIKPNKCKQCMTHEVTFPQSSRLIAMETNTDRPAPVLLATSDSQTYPRS
jgi:hypothetical protein